MPGADFIHGGIMDANKIGPKGLLGQALATYAAHDEDEMQEWMEALTEEQMDQLQTEALDMVDEITTVAQRKTILASYWRRGFEII